MTEQTPRAVIPVEEEIRSDLRGTARNIGIAAAVLMVGGLVTAVAIGNSRLGGLLIMMGIFMFAATAPFRKSRMRLEVPQAVRLSPPVLEYQRLTTHQQ